MGWFDSKPSESKQLSIISKRVKDITEDTRTINESLISITSTNKLLTVVMDKFQNAKFEKQKTRIDALALSDEYKKKLHLSIDGCKVNSLKVMEPLVQQSLQLEGGMIAAEVKAKSQLMILETQRKVITSGNMQLNVLRDIETEGIENQKEIKKLVQDIEGINGMVKSTLLSYNDAQSSINSILDNADSPEPQAVDAGVAELESIIADFKID